jgi:hypothetical protein
MVRSTRVALCALMLTSAIAAPAGAQRLVPTGARVRVRVPEARAQIETRLSPVHVIRGEVTGESDDSLWVRPSPATSVIGISKPGIRTMAVSRGAPNRIRSLIVEGLGGALLGAIEAFFIHNLILRDDFGDTPWDAAMVGAAIGGGTFAVIGFIWPVEYWRRVPLAKTTPD